MVTAAIVTLPDSSKFNRRSFNRTANGKIDIITDDVSEDKLVRRR